MNRRKKTYTKRNKILADIGFASYDEYLKSDLWRSIRKKVIEENNGECQCCDHRGENVHHASYNRMLLLGLTTSNLVFLCRECHENVHDIEKKHNTFVEEATSMYKKLYAKKKVVAVKNKHVKNQHVKKVKQRIGSMRIVAVSKLPETLHHSFHSILHNYKVKKINPVIALKSYIEKKRKINDTFYVELIDKYENEMITYANYLARLLP